jgi:DNA-binding SARP family transcriptional activator
MATHPVDGGVRLEMLGRFRVLLGGRAVAQDGWPVRRAAELVQLLALADGHRRLRDHVIEALWPHLEPEAGAANLRKAAHHARQALGKQDAVVLRGGLVALFPSHQVETDVDHFESAAKAALRVADPLAHAEVASSYTGDLLPDALYEEWTQVRREHLRSLYRQLLRRSGQWERLVEADHTEEFAYRELMKAALRGGNRHGAIRWYGRLRTALEHEVGLLPSPETVALYEECVAGLRPTGGAVIGRQVELAQVRAALRSAPGELGALVVRGAAGIGKSALPA